MVLSPEQSWGFPYIWRGAEEETWPAANDDAICTPIDANRWDEKAFTATTPYRSPPLGLRAHQIGLKIFQKIRPSARIVAKPRTRRHIARPDISYS
jgi:hypothetical protein